METRVMTDTAGDQAHAQALLAASRAISSSLDLDETLRLIVREAAAISEAPAVRLFLLDDSGRTLQYRVGTGIPSEEEEGLTIPVGESFSGQVVVTGQPLMEGSPDRTLTIRTEQGGAETVSLQVTDTGCGIQSALQERIFDPFFTTKEIGKGTGLGLSICHGIIQAHGGKIEVESPVAGGRGTRFSILLPCRATDRGEGSARPGDEMSPPGGDGKERG
jgi:GAF domain-containing protein